MPTSTANKSVVPLIVASNGNSIPAGADPLRAAVDLRTSPGGSQIVGSMKNEGALSQQCICRVYGASTTGNTPGVAAADMANWREIAVIALSGAASGLVTPIFWRVPIGVLHLMIEFTGNNGAGVTCGAECIRIDSIATT